METIEQNDRVRLKAKKGTWKRFIRLLFKCRLPWLTLGLYIVTEVFFINMGVNETDYTAQLFAGDTSAALVTKLVGVIFLNLLLANISVFLNQLTTAEMDRNMRETLTQKILKLPMSFFKEEDPRDAIYRIVRNSVVISSTIMLFILPIAFSFYKTIVIFGKVFRYDWRLSLILLAFIPLQFLIAFVFGRINFSLSERDSHISAGLMHRLAEMVTNIPLAKAFAKEDREALEGEALVDRLYKINIKGGWFDQLKELSTSIVTLTQAAIMTFVGSMLLSSGALTTRSWISFFLFSGTFSNAVYELMMYWNNLKVIQGGGDRVAEIMYAEEERQSGAPAEQLSGDLKIEDLHFGYSAEMEVLHGVTAEFPQGTRTALLGVSGCGKTTLLNLIMRIYEPDSGSITINGVNISDYALQDYRRQFVMVSQDEMLFSGTIRDNITYGCGEVSDADLTEAMKKSGAWDFVQALPQGVDTSIAEYGGSLSGGQKQRLSLTRAFLSNAPYLILDEPAAALDAIAVDALIRVLKQVSADKTLIVIGHTPSILPLVERVVILEDGCVVDSGPIEALKKSGTFLQAFLREEADHE